MEQNHNLIYKFLRDRGLSVDEYYGSAAEGICKAAMIYDESKEIKFSVLAYKCMRNMCLDLRKEKRRHKRVSEFESVGLNSRVNARHEYIDTIGNEKSDINNVILYDALLDFCRSLSARMKKVLYLKLDNASVNEIALILCVSRSTVIRDLKKINKLARNELLNL